MSFKSLKSELKLLYLTSFCLSTERWDSQSFPFPFHWVGRAFNSFEWSGSFWYDEVCYQGTTTDRQRANSRTLQVCLLKLTWTISCRLNVWALICAAISCVESVLDIFAKWVTVSKCTCLFIFKISVGAIDMTQNVLIGRCEGMTFISEWQNNSFSRSAGFARHLHK